MLWASMVLTYVFSRVQLLYIFIGRLVLGYIAIVGYIVRLHMIHETNGSHSLGFE